MQKLRETRGELVVSTPVRIIVFVLFLSAFFQCAQVWTSITVIKSKTSEAVLAVAAINGSNVYNGIREGVGQARTINQDGTEWSYPVATDEVIDIMVNNMGYDRVDSRLTKKDRNGTLVHALNDFTVTYTNVESGLNFVTNCTLEIPLKFGGELLPPLRIPIRVKSKYEAKF